MMGKLQKLLKGLGLILQKPAWINNVINDEKLWKKYVQKNYGIDSFPLGSIDELIPGFSANIPVFAFLDGGSLPTDIALLMKLAEKTKDCQYFEIGTWRGESVANVAKIASACYTLNLPDDDLRKLGLPEKYIKLHGMFSKNLKNVTHLKADSKHFDYQSLNKKFDLIFVDGDHHYEYVKNDTQKVFDFLTHEDSIIVWHDYARNPELVRHDVMAGILDGLPEGEHKYLYHIGNTLSAIYTRQKLPTQKLIYPLEPKHYFEIDLRLKKL